MTNPIRLYDFHFKIIPYGFYIIYYTSPVTNKTWKMLCNDTRLIDLTKNAEYPKVKHLNQLKALCKQGVLSKR